MPTNTQQQLSNLIQQQQQLQQKQKLAGSEDDSLNIFIKSLSFQNNQFINFTKRSSNLLNFNNANPNMNNNLLSNTISRPSQLQQNSQTSQFIKCLFICQI